MNPAIYSRGANITLTPAQSPSKPHSNRALVALAIVCALLVGTHQLYHVRQYRAEYALRHGNWKAADELLSAWGGARPSVVHDALLYAVQQQNAARVRLLLTHCRKINLDSFVLQQVGFYDADFVSTLRGSPIADPALQFERVEILAALLDAGANPNAHVPITEGDHTRTALGVLLAHRPNIRGEAGLRTSASMETLLRSRGAQLSIFDAVRFGAMDELQNLLNEGANPNGMDAGGRSLIYIAANNNQVDVIKYLVEHGADVNTVIGSAMSATRDTALMTAESFGYADAAKELVQLGAHVKSPPNSERYLLTPLVAAAPFANPRHIEFLLQHGADPTATTFLGLTPIMAASTRLPPSVRVRRTGSIIDSIERQTKMCAELDILYRYHPDINARDRHGRTALMAAAWSRAITSSLLAHGANPNIIDGDGGTALMYAVRLGKLDVIDELVANGADINLRNASGDSALAQAQLLREAVPEAAACASHLHALGAHLTVAEAVYCGDDEAFAWAIANGGKVDESLPDGTPLLIAAVNHGSMPMIQAILCHHPPIDAVNNRGWTALMTAASNGQQDIVKVLLENGARIDIKSHRGATALQLAIRHHHDELKPLLQPSGT